MRSIRLFRPREEPSDREKVGGVVTGTPDEIREEKRRIRYLRGLVDLATQIIMQSRLSRSDAEALVEATRGQILQLFPGQEETYEIVYRRRFDRLIREFTTPGAKILPFRRPES